jgi:hypothetical protein
VTMTYSVTCDGFRFEMVFGFFGKSHILLDASTPIKDAKYRKALAYIQSLMPYFEAVGHIDEYGSLYMGEDYDRVAKGLTSDPNVLMTIEAYEKDLVPVSKSTYEIAIDLRDYDRPVRQAPAPKPRKVRTGYVYLLKADSGLYKIGRAIDPKNRGKTFGVQLPFEVDFVCTIKSDDYEALELELHEKFKDFRVRGEWFNLAPDDVEYIKSLAVTA